MVAPQEWSSGHIPLGTPLPGLPYRRECPSMSHKRADDGPTEKERR
jgi:hypothetical protein